MHSSPIKIEGKTVQGLFNFSKLSPHFLAANSFNRNSPTSGLHLYEPDFILQVALAKGHKSSQNNKHQLTSLKANIFPSCHVRSLLGSSSRTTKQRVKVGEDKKKK